MDPSPDTNATAHHLSPTHREAGHPEKVWRTPVRVAGVGNGTLFFLYGGPEVDKQCMGCVYVRCFILPSDATILSSPHLQPEEGIPGQAAGGERAGGLPEAPGAGCTSSECTVLHIK
jgi:hypothetical protein